jgi:flagellar assembly protein FliH
MNEVDTETDKGTGRVQDTDTFEKLKLEQIIQASQTSYKPTPYEDMSYEIVGEPPQEAIFVPMTVKVVGQLDITTDPMFANYGGLYEGETQERWHLPDDVAFHLEQSALQAKNAEPSVEFTESEFNDRLQKEREEGYQQGFEEASQKAEDHRQAQANQITELLRDIGIQIREELQRLEYGCVSVAVDIAERLLRRSVEINPDYLIPVVREAFNISSESQALRIRLSPQDYEFVEICEVKEQLGSQGSMWTFAPDESIKSGCVVETFSGEIDMQIDKAFDRVKDEVLKIKGLNAKDIR